LIASLNLSCGDELGKDEDSQDRRSQTGTHHAIQNRTQTKAVIAEKSSQRTFRVELS